MLQTRAAADFTQRCSLHTRRRRRHLPPSLLSLRLVALAFITSPPLLLQLHVGSIPVDNAVEGEPEVQCGSQAIGSFFILSNLRLDTKTRFFAA